MVMMMMMTLMLMVMMMLMMLTMHELFTTISATIMTTGSRERS